MTDWLSDDITQATILFGLALICGALGFFIAGRSLLGGRFTRSDDRAVNRHARDRIRAYTQEMAAREATRPHTSRADKW